MSLKNIYVFLPLLAGANIPGQSYSQEICAGNPVLGQAISCEYSETSTQDINLNIQDTTIETNGEGISGVRIKHGGKGDILVDLVDTTISTDGSKSPGVSSLHQGEGEIKINFLGKDAETADITTNFVDSDEYQTMVTHGIIGWHEGIGTVDITVSDAEIVIK